VAGVLEQLQQLRDVTVPQKHKSTFLGEFAHPNVLANSTASVVKRQYVQLKMSPGSWCFYGTSGIGKAACVGSEDAPCGGGCRLLAFSMRRPSPTLLQSTSVPALQAEPSGLRPAVVLQHADAPCPVVPLSCTCSWMGPSPCCCWHGTDRPALRRCAGAPCTRVAGRSRRVDLDIQLHDPTGPRWHRSAGWGHIRALVP
jgi:hypothetical protein